MSHHAMSGAMYARDIKLANASDAQLRYTIEARSKSHFSNN